MLVAGGKLELPIKYFCRQRQVVERRYYRVGGPRNAETATEKACPYLFRYLGAPFRAIQHPGKPLTIVRRRIEIERSHLTLSDMSRVSET